MKHYTDTIPLPLAEKLKEKGMPVRIWRNMFDDSKGTDATFGECFDWLMSEKGLLVLILPTWDSPSDAHLNYEYRITDLNVPFKEFTDNVSYNWHEAANAAIEKALTLI